MELHFTCNVALVSGQQRRHWTILYIPRHSPWWAESPAVTGQYHCNITDGVPCVLLLIHLTHLFHDWSLYLLYPFCSLFWILKIYFVTFFQFAITQIEPLSSKGGFWKDLHTGCSRADVFNSTAVDRAEWGDWLHCLPPPPVSLKLWKQDRVILIAACRLRVSHFCGCQGWTN